MNCATTAGLFIAASLALGQNVTESDKRFVTEAAKGGLMEVEMGKLAVSHAEHSDVKTFAQRMVDDHSKANDALKQVASTKNISLPTEMDPKHKAEMDRLSKLKGAEFDRSYMRLMVTDHKKDVSEFSRMSKSAKDPDIRKFAADTLPTLKDHLGEAEKISATVHRGAAKSKK